MRRQQAAMSVATESKHNRTTAVGWLKEETVGNRLSQILNKIGVSNRTQAALWAREQSLDCE